MNISSESLLIFVILIPGFVSSTILNMIVIRKPKDTLSTLVEALMFSFLIYSVLVGAFRVQPTLDTGIVSSTDLEHIRQAINPYFVIWALISSVGFPLVLGFIINRDLHMRLFRALRITDRSSRVSVWLDVFMDQRRYIICNLSGGRRVFGWPMYYSDDSENPQIYLYDPAWIDDKGNYTDLDIHGLFLVEKNAIESIEFTKITKVNARPKNAAGDGDG